MKSIKSYLLGAMLVGIVFIITIFPVSTALAESFGPNDPGSGSNLAGIGSEPWLNPDEITTPGSPYASVTLYQGHRYSNYLHGSQYAFAIPDYVQVVGIEVTINRMSNSRNPNIVDNVVSLVKAGEIVGENKAFGAAPWPTTITSYTYGGPTDLWGIDWLPADINDPNFGVVLAVYRDNNGNNSRDANVDSMQITVYYEYSTTSGVECGDGSPVTYGDSLLCVATVTRVAGDLTPSGSVNWSTDGSGAFDPNPCVLSGSDGVATCSTTYTPSSVGTGTHLVTASYTGDGYFSPNQASQSVTVTTRPITATADAQDKLYGDPDPELTYQVTDGSLAFSDTFTGTLTREAGEDVGAYAILQGSLSINENYDLAYVGDFLTINRAQPNCEVYPYAVDYDGLEHTAQGTCLGVFGEELAGLDLTATSHTNAGSYSDSWAFTDETGNYLDASGMVEDSINMVDAFCQVTPYDVVYDGLEHSAEGSCAGVNDELLIGLDLSGTFHTNAGIYTDTWAFHDPDGNYNDQAGTVQDNISKTEASCEVTPYDVTYDASLHTAEGSCTGVMGENLEGLDLSATSHTDAGNYSDAWTFTDVSGNYNDQAGSLEDNISKANATCEVVGYLVEYDREAHTASGLCSGVLGEELAGLDLANTTHTELGSYLNDPWTFSDVTGNYQDTSGTVNDEITTRAVTIVADSKTKVVGQPDPELTYQLTVGSLLEGDAFSGELTRQPGEITGTYTILQGTLILPSYYTITYVSASFTIISGRLFLPMIMR